MIKKKEKKEEKFVTVKLNKLPTLKKIDSREKEKEMIKLLFEENRLALRYLEEK